MIRRRASWMLILAAAAFALVLPSSIDGTISRPLSLVSLLGTCMWLAALLAVAPAPAPVIGTAASAGMLGGLLLFTLTSPFAALSLGVVVIYTGLALLYPLNLRGVILPRAEWIFGGMTVVILALGFAIALDVKVVDAFLVRWYGAFYPELLTNMVVLNNKPVLTFGTHSMAGFMFYLFFYAQLLTWRQHGGWWRGAAALGYIALMFLLTSTTGAAFGVVATVQVAMHIATALRRYAVLLMVVGGLAAVTALVTFGADLGSLMERIENAVVGDRVRGLFARYSADGLLATSMAYLSESPFSPIGFSATESLYLGDSGIVVNLLRGSVPLLVAVYGGLWVFLRTNLRRARTAAWIWVCIVLFEFGFTPLQYFRFVALAPFLVVCINSLDEGGFSMPAGRSAPGAL